MTLKGSLNPRQVLYRPSLHLAILKLEVTISRDKPISRDTPLKGALADHQQQVSPSFTVLGFFSFFFLPYFHLLWASCSVL